MKTLSAWLCAVVAVAVLCPVAMPGGAWGQDKAPAAAGVAAVPSKASSKGLLKLKHRVAGKTGVQRSVVGVGAGGSLQPKVLVHPDSVEFLGDAGQVIKKVTPPKNTTVDVRSSKAGKTIGVHFRRGIDEKGAATSAEYFVFDQTGRQLLHIPKFSGPTLTVPAPSGDYIVAWSGQDTPGGPPGFYDARGLRNKWARGGGADRWPRGYSVVDVIFSADGKHLAARAMKGGSVMTAFFNQKGDLLGTYGGQGALAFGPGDRWVAVANESGTHILDLSGKELRVLAAPGNVDGGIEVSRDGKSILLARPSGEVSRYNADTGSRLWEQRFVSASLPEGARAILGGLDATPDLSRFVVLTLTSKLVPAPASDGSMNRRRVYTDASALVCDDNGIIQDSIVLPPEDTAKANLPDLRISEDGQSIVVPGASGALVYSTR